jgi:hypothetical protein
MKKISILITLILSFTSFNISGCNSSNSQSQEENISIPSISDKENISEETENIFEEENISVEIVETKKISILSNELTFGDSEIVNFSKGIFPDIDFSNREFDETIFNISFQFDEVQDLNTSIIFKIEELNSQKTLAVVFPNVEIKNREINSSKTKNLYIYGIKSSGLPLISSIPFSNPEKYLYSENGQVFIDISSSMDIVSEILGLDVSLGDYLKSYNKLKLMFVFTEVDLIGGEDLSKPLLDRFLGDVKTSLLNKLSDRNNSGVYGEISF